MNAVLFKSATRFDAFLRTLQSRSVQVSILDFDDPDWRSFDFKSAQIAIYFPSFIFTSNHPLSLYRVRDNISYILDMNPALKTFPDPQLLNFYNDKYAQYLALTRLSMPIPKTIPLDSPKAVQTAHEQLGYPMVIKNRFGAGGDFVYRIKSRSELLALYRISMLDFAHLRAALYLFQIARKRSFLYSLLRIKRMTYPFLAPPLLAQAFLQADRDLKTVVVKGRILEAHWRAASNTKTWKFNIDGGGTGIWSAIPPEAIQLSERLARSLSATFLNIDLIPSSNGFLVTEFSPVWHHYRYKEKPSFIYSEEYNLPTPLTTSLKLEPIIVDTLLALAQS